MAKVLIAYYTRGGNTQKLAEAVMQGVQSVAGVTPTLKPVGKVTTRELAGYDGIILGSPVYYGTMSAEVKKLLDDSVSIHGRLAGKVGGAFATSGCLGGGTETTVLDIVKALLIHGMVVQGNHDGSHYGAVCVGAPDANAIKEGTALGKLVANLVVRLGRG